MDYKTAYGIANDLFFDKSKFVVYTSGEISGNGDGADSFVYLGIIPFKKWRVIGLGIGMKITGGSSTVAESVEFGFLTSDLGGLDSDAFGKLTQDVTAGKEWSASDMIFYGDTHIITPDGESNGGESVWRVGEAEVGKLFNVWNSKAAVIRFAKKNVAGSTATVMGFMLIEVKRR